MPVGYVTHDESMIELFIEEPEYAEELLNDVLTDGNDYEIQRVKFWYDEAKARLQDGHDLSQFLSPFSEAVGTAKAAMA